MPSQESDDDDLAANERAFRFDNLVGAGPAMRHVMQRLERVVAVNSTVLILGETGTGKELIARTIHEHSPRRDHPFVGFNAAAIPEGLVERNCSVTSKARLPAP